MRRFAACVLGAFVLSALPCRAGDRSGPPERLTFEQHIRPLFKAYCFECHGEGEKLKGGLDLRLRRLVVAGGKSGPAVEPGKVAESILYEKIEQGAMPPSKKKLSREQVALIGRWIAAGAPAAGPEPAKLSTGMLITAQDRAYWAFQPVRRPAMPRVTHADQLRSPVDAFLLARLEQQHLTFNPEADRVTLLRRATFDLTGLPPTPAEVDRFLADDRPDAYEREVDRLLDSPHYGERWGRHWLDVAGYADSDGYAAADVVRPWAWRYRDYVIRSINADKPFDQFVVEQLAGDELVKPPYRNLRPEDVDRLTATGFLRMAPDGTGAPGVDPPAARNQVVADTIKVVSSSLLGLTVGCAQCHNHRYDPIPQADYYRLRALFEPAYDPKAWRAPAQRLVALTTDADRARAAAVEDEAAAIDRERLAKQAEYIERTLAKELAKLPADMRGPIRAARDTPVAKRTAEQQKLLREHPSVNVSSGSLYLYDQKAADDLKGYADRAAAVRARKPAEEFVQALTEIPGHVPLTHLFRRGDFEQPAEVVAPGGLTILDDTDPLRIPPPAAGATSGRRLAFARWLTDGNHPLVARVLVNRVWMHHFGKGLVGTSADFGALGERPTHPELLDWLADDFVSHGWRLKRLHRMLVTSTAYRQASRRDPEKERLDPDNRLLGRMPVRRLEAETVRDAVLAVSGRLDDQPYGKPVPVHQDETGQVVVGVDTNDSAGRPTGKVVSLGGQEFRRSVYVQVRRSQPLSLLETFDGPTMEPNCEARNASTVAPQALLLMNSAFAVTQAEAFAERVRKEAGPDLEAQVRRAWKLAFATTPSNQEVRDAVAFLKSQPPARALSTFCHALLSSNPFLYVD